MRFVWVVAWMRAVLGRLVIRMHEAEQYAHKEGHPDERRPGYALTCGASVR